MSRSFVPRRSVLRGALGAGALAAAAGPLAACAPGSSGSEPRKLTGTPSASAKGEITIWNRSGDLFKVFDAAIDAFRKAYPDIKVNHQAVDIDAKLANTLISGTDLPDGSFWDDAKIGGQAEHLYDLTDLIAPYRDKTSAYKLSVNTVGGRIYGVPWDLDPGLLWYREDLLEDAGVDPAGLKTYDDLLAAARSLREKNPKARPLHMEKDPFLGQLWLEMLAGQQGTSLADADGQVRLDSRSTATSSTGYATPSTTTWSPTPSTSSRPTSPPWRTVSRHWSPGRCGGPSPRSNC